MNSLLHLFKNIFKSLKRFFPSGGQALKSACEYSRQNEADDGIFKYVTDDQVRIRIDRPRALIEAGANLASLDEYQSLLLSIEEILKKQDADAQRRLEQSSYYGDTGKWVQYAAWDARQAINNSLESHPKTSCLDEILLSVARAHAHFREYYNYDDEDAYGSATFGEILRDLLCLQKKVEGRESFDLDSLYELRLE